MLRGLGASHHRQRRNPRAGRAAQLGVREDEQELVHPSRYEVGQLTEKFLQPLLNASEQLQRLL